MRLVLDVLGAPRDSGGMRLFAEEIVRSWLEEFEDDELVVIGGSWIRRVLGDLPRLRTWVVPGEGIVGRALGQQVAPAVGYWVTRADAVLSVSPIVSSLVPRAVRYCVVHDWRHLKNPGEFGGAQRAYRRLWRASVRRAAGVGVISPKTLEETSAVEPRARVALTENGHDHPRRWDVDVRREDPGHRLVTFGHHVNKRPELVVRAVAGLGTVEGWSLTVLGARGTEAERLRELAVSLGVAEQVRLPGFVSTTEYRALVSTCDVVVMASTDEGFGLPVVEAKYFGIPVVATSDSGLGHVHGATVELAPATPEGIREALERVLRDGGASRPGRADVRSWRQTCADLRGMIAARPPTSGAPDATGGRSSRPAVS